MGQSSSTQRNHRHSTPSERFFSFHAHRSRLDRNEDMNQRHNSDQMGDVHSPPGMEADNSGIQHGPTGVEQPETLQPMMSSLGEQQQQMGSMHEEDGSHLGQSQRDSRSAIFARMAARRQSTMSRLGSRILPNSVIRGLLSSEEETPAEGHAHRHGIVSRSVPRTETTHSSSRFSPFSGISRRRSARGPYYIPRSDPLLDPSSPGAYLTPPENGSEATRSPWRRSARLNRMRNSISGPITHMFGQSSNISGQNLGPPPQLPLGSLPGEDHEGLLPYPTAMDTRMDFDEPHELDPVEPAVGSSRPTSPMSQSAQGSPGSRQLPDSLRVRSSRMLRREEQTPLSRVLQLAAAAIAAQLSGTTGPVMPNIQSLGNDGLDGSLENFIQSLQHATSAQQPTHNDAPTPAGDTAPQTPVNFLRVFRFANSDNARPSGPADRPSADSDNASGTGTQMDVDGPTEGQEGRTVTLVVVGVRSVPSGNGSTGEQGGNAAPGLDALLRLPFLTPGNLSRSQDSNSTSPSRGESRPRLPQLRLRPRSNGSNSMGEPSSQGHLHPSRRFSDTASRAPLTSVPSILSESPPGPNPPPSTPAEPGLSAVSSGASTPSRRPSVASAIPPSVLPQLDENRALQPTAESVEDGIPPTATRQRRRSDSEYARHRELGSGAVRRNGVVEPDNGTPPTGRSWLIYVVGTNLSENHPAFATPSLFTDVRSIIRNPTYEDMILLSSLLGPVKPPVATQDDLTSAGGMFRLVEYGGTLIAEALEGTGNIHLPEGERCLICLSDYEVADELRQLNKCKHLFHRDCIDQWLTTGRNSCPLCRGQGVAETSNAGPAAETPDVTAA
ncbi:hypothetical protein ASPACDRAFT_22739 [Aspergillus aculeatus ATCC 16872]|uniref:RING-type domain-containing protein n=1 Tax=Aspergillus aculeatus (strain ATCC 16872 / CBS 172.66 / WB 5094) TaxID=690307 RepID=A0A1L9X5L7_ASPA1|nr:uncharacterized protein ASPACDRAFT_22739 [Aspergillus aculeatus ATCC 16872]OJK03745.1 hypothetical protein ASPACDRAFT_22739 [Aspergillus aculeatus ATCC 16872]